MSDDSSSDSTDINSDENNAAEFIAIENSSNESITIKQSKDGFVINIPILGEIDGINQDELNSSQESIGNDEED